jgi:thymidine phosphorylase
MSKNYNFLYLRRLGIDTHQEPVVYMRQDCHVCRAEGFDAQTRVRVTTDTNSVIATVHKVTSDILSHEEAGLSEAAWVLLNAQDGQKAQFTHPAPNDSLSYVRGKIYGRPFTTETAAAIINDITQGRYSDIHLAAFVTACSGSRLVNGEITALTEAMVNVGDRLHWDKPLVLDKHCVGGLPGNRTTPIVVSIVTAAGLTMPKTSSRAITSPAGTADTMETLAPVDLSLEQIRQVVSDEGGCIAWGGAVSLSPADDILIRVEKALDLDSEGQLVASVLSKKIAAGATHTLIDIPVGATAKIRSQEYAEELASQLVLTGQHLGLTVKTVFSDGNQPVGRGIGPALEAHDILQVLQQNPHAPTDLIDRSLILSGHLLEMGGAAKPGEGYRLAKSILDSGKAWEKFQAICKAQGGIRTPGKAPYTFDVKAPNSGYITYINNRLIAKLAKLAGAPAAATAGLYFLVKLGQKIDKGSPLFTLHAESKGELHYALEFLKTHPDAVRIEDEAI